MPNFGGCRGDVVRDIYTKKGEELILIIKKHCQLQCSKRGISTDVVCDNMKVALDFIRSSCGVLSSGFKGEEVVLYLKEFKISVALAIYKYEVIMITGVLNGDNTGGIMMTGRNQKIFILEGENVTETNQAQLKEETKIE